MKTEDLDNILFSTVSPTFNINTAFCVDAWKQKQGKSSVVLGTR